MRTEKKLITAFKRDSASRGFSAVSNLSADPRSAAGLMTHAHLPLELGTVPVNWYCPPTPPPSLTALGIWTDLE